MKHYPEYIDVAVALPVAQTYTYGVPDHYAGLADVGKRVLIPFGHRRVTGYILGPRTEVASREIKPIEDILDEGPLFHADLIPFFKWIADYYLYPIGEVIKIALPKGLNLYETTCIQITAVGREVLKEFNRKASEHELLTFLTKGPGLLTDIKKKWPDLTSPHLTAMEKRNWIVETKALRGGRVKPKKEKYLRIGSSDIEFAKLSRPRKEIIRFLKAGGEKSLRELKSVVPTAPRLINSMAASGHLKIVEKQIFRDPFGEPIALDEAPVLTEEQAKVSTAVITSLEKGYKTYLLAGVTGSGKTEVYMQIAAEILSRKRTVLVLVPEIILISQVERRFRARFGDSIAVLHSGLSAGGRLDQWLRIHSGKAPIVIGTRSAVFAPLSDLGLIVVDEEHDASYKQDNLLRYNARDLAVVRAKLNNCVAILGSATPSVESCFNAERNKFAEVNLKKRVEERLLPDIKVVDLRKIKDRRGARRFISDELFDAMKETISRGEQVLLFLNRRGFASFPVCGSCGESVKCKNCDISLTLHKQDNAFKCHYCGFGRSANSRCNGCGSSKIRLLGLGTEKIEADVRKLFPGAITVRMDRDTTRRKGTILKMLKDLRHHAVDILVGTQMVAKGHDFPGITLVGIICADLSLSFPDFRAGERTFQLLAQVAGRAGRGEAPGKVVLQTYSPDHFSIQTAEKQDLKAFYREEIVFRKTLKYPPFSRMVHLKISANDHLLAGRYAMSIGEKCKELKNRERRFDRTIEILGPLEAPLARIANRFRWQILLKSPEVKTLHDFIHRLVSENKKDFRHRRVNVVVDVDPVFMM
jgi:primosomal protein N' (replication factor Y)